MVTLKADVMDPVMAGGRDVNTVVKDGAEKVTLRGRMLVGGLTVKRLLGGLIVVGRALGRTRLGRTRLGRLMLVGRTLGRTRLGRTRLGRPLLRKLTLVGTMAAVGRLVERRVGERRALGRMLTGTTTAVAVAMAGFVANMDSRTLMTAGKAGKGEKSVV